MVIDSSAIVGLLVDETVNEAIIEALRADDQRLVAAPTRLEMSIVMQRSGIPGGVASVQAALAGLDVVDVPFDRHLADLAVAAHERATTGRGSTSGTASPMRWPSRPASRSSAWGTTSPGRTSRWCPSARGGRR